MQQPRTFCIYHQLHQPFRINKVSDYANASIEDFFVGPNPGKEARDLSNENIFNLVAQSSYIPGTQYWIEMINKYPELKLTLSISGVLLEQAINFPKYGQKVIDNIKELLKTGRVELMSETYYHSLSFLYDLEEYLAQILKHRKLIKELFDYDTLSFRNTELIYHNEIAEIIRRMGFKTIVAQKNIETIADPLMAAGFAEKFALKESKLKSINHFRITNPLDKLPVILNETSISVDLFSMKDPENARKTIFESDLKLINFFTDFEIYGEHNENKPGGIMDTFEGIIKDCISAGMSFGTITEVGREFAEGRYQTSGYSTWANQDMDLRSWVGNSNQDQAHRRLAGLLDMIKNIQVCNDNEYSEIYEMWRKLSTSDHFYYMPHLDGGDGEMVNYFSPYASQHDAFSTFFDACDFLTLKVLQYNHKCGDVLNPVETKDHSIFNRI